MPKKILIVEDEANIRELLRLYLEREGYTVLEAENGVEGIKKWKSDKPDNISVFILPFKSSLLSNLQFSSHIDFIKSPPLYCFTLLILYADTFSYFKTIFLYHYSPFI